MSLWACLISLSLTEHTDGAEPQKAEDARPWRWGDAKASGAARD